MSAEVSRVLVTGASGYIACHVVQQLLRAGHQVRGTVRSLKDEAKVKAVQDLVPEAADRLELVEASLEDESCWDSIVADCSHVLHLACPFPDSKNEEEVIRPVVQGTMVVLYACANAAKVKRVVFTSSIAAVSGGFLPGHFNEEDWPAMDTPDMIPYAKSKALAERAVWDFMEKLPEEQKFELVTINPSFVIGPALNAGLSLTMGLMKALLTNAMPFVPRVTLPLVDVRDVATAHVRAMTATDVAGKRIILHSGYLWFRDFVQCMHDEFAPQGYKVPTWQAPDFLIRFLRLFVSDLRDITKNLGEVTDFDNARMKTLLDITPIDPRTSILDMSYGLIEAGFVAKTDGYKGPQGVNVQ